MPPHSQRHGSRFVRYAGAAGGFIDRDGFTFCAGRIFSVETDTGSTMSTARFWASGAALFIQAEAWREVGGLNQFSPMEEIDLCWRLKNRVPNWRCGQSVVFHLGGGTLQISPFKSYLNFRNNLYMLVKNHHQCALYPMLLRRMVLDSIAALKFLVEGSTPLFAAVWKAHWEFKANFEPLKTAGIEIHACRSVQKSSQPLGMLRSILVDYFIRRKHTFGQLDSSASGNNVEQLDALCAEIAVRGREFPRRFAAWAHRLFGRRWRSLPWPCGLAVCTGHLSIVTHTRDAHDWLINRLLIGADNRSHAVLLSNPLAKYAADIWAISAFSKCRIWPNQKPSIRFHAKGRLDNTFHLCSGHRHLSQWNRLASIE